MTTIPMVRNETLAPERLTASTLRHYLTGTFLQPGDDGYDHARRLINQRFDGYPIGIVCARTAQDVAYGIQFAREQGLEVTVRSGGHSVAGHGVSTGSVMIDLSQMREIVVDPVQKIAHVAPGATNGELVIATHPYGLTTTTGTCATVGMGGSTLGGGIGWLMGRFGMTIDNLLSCELVTAEGNILTVNAEEHPDLFWAVRGGGGNFGIVTKFIYQLHTLAPVLGGMLIYPRAVAPRVLRVYREVTQNAPDELIVHAVFALIPEMGPALMIQVCYSGDNPQAGERWVAPFRAAATPVMDLVGMRSYADLYMMLTPPLPSGASWVDAVYSLRQPSDKALDTLVDYAAAQPSPLTMVNIHQIHGAATRIAPDATAFALRYPHWVVANIGGWLDGDGTAERAWAYAGKAAMQPHLDPALYVNFLGDEGNAAIRASYGANYERLAAIKTHYDPTNFFHRNQNIRPISNPQ